MKLNDICAVVTGGASGLGFATTKMLLNHGAKVIIFDIKCSCRIWKHKKNVTSEEAVKKGIELAVQKFGKINCVINCAGIYAKQDLINVSEGNSHDFCLFEHIMKVNVIGTFNVMRLAALSMAKSSPGEDGERGVIINTSSITAFQGVVGLAAYSASKAAIIGMTLPVARELAQYGIRCVTISPGVFKTEMAASSSSETVSKVKSQVPFPRRMGEPEEFADLVKSILENRMINGTTISIDAALRLA